MQTPHVGIMFADRFMLMPKIINEHGNAWFILVEYPPKRFTLAALIAINWRVDANGPQLLCTRPSAVIQKVGKDDDVGMLTQPVKAVYRPVNRLLPVHFGIKKSVEQLPHLTALDDGAVMLMTQRLSPVAMDKVEMDVMRLIQPVTKRNDHVQQHFVAIGNEKWSRTGDAHASNSCRACTNTTGETPMTAAQAIRSGSYPSKNDRIAACVLRSITLLRKPSGVSPVSDNSRSARDSSISAHANAWKAIPDASNLSFVSSMAFA